jgi:hypothetical protein
VSLDLTAALGAPEWLSEQSKIRALTRLLRSLCGPSGTTAARRWLKLGSNGVGEAAAQDAQWAEAQALLQGAGWQIVV